MSTLPINNILLYFCNYFDSFFLFLKISDQVIKLKVEKYLCIKHYWLKFKVQIVILRSKLNCEWWWI